MKQNDIQNMSGVGPGNTEANDAVMRPFVIPSPTFTSSESLSRGPPRRQHKKSRRVSAPVLIRIKRRE